jgi:hypothetical protein
MEMLQEDGNYCEAEAGGPEDRYGGGGHAAETAESADGCRRQEAINELVAVIRQASRELALLMAEIRAEAEGGNR